MLIRFNVRSIKIGQECHGETPPPAWHSARGCGPPASVREHPPETPLCVSPSDVQPPEGRSRDGLLTVSLREGSRLHLCADTQDDAV